MLPCPGTSSRRTSAQGRQSSDHEQPSPGSRQPHIEPTAIGEKAQGTGSIIPYGRKQDNLLLPAFEPIHSFDFDLGELPGAAGTQNFTKAVSVIRVDIEQIVQERNLRYIRRYDANVLAAEVLGMTLEDSLACRKLNVHLVPAQQIFQNGAHYSCVSHIDSAAILCCLETIMIQEHDRWSASSQCVDYKVLRHWRLQLGKDISSRINGAIFQ
jgi:hypothetical protein